MATVRPVEVQAALAPIRPLFEVVFSYTGPLAVKASTRYRPHIAGKLFRVSYSLSTGTTGTVTISRNGVVVATVVMSAAHALVDVTEVLFTPNDYLQVAITNAGASEDLTVQALFR